MATFEYALLIRLVPPVFLFWLAWVVGRSPYPALGNRLLGTFFCLLGLGFSLEFFAHLAHPVSPPLARLLQVLGVAAGVVDPLVLLAFGLAFPDPRPALRSRALWAAAASVAFLVLHLALRAGAVGAWVQTLYVDGLYLTSFGLLLHAHGRERHRFRQRLLFFVTLGVGFAALSRTAAVFLVHPLPPVIDAALLFLLASVATALLLAGAFHAWARHVGHERPGPLFAWLVAALLAFSATHHLVFSLGGLGYHLAGQYFGLRWVVVGGILGYGILRHQIFDFGLRTRHATLFVASVSAGVVVAFAVALPLDGAIGLTTARLAGLLGGIVAAAATYGLLDWGWQRVRPGVELPVRFVERRIELYEAALEYALGDEQRARPDHQFSATLREVFQISPSEHDRVTSQWSDPQAPPR